MPRSELAKWLRGLGQATRSIGPAGASLSEAAIAGGSGKGSTRERANSSSASKRRDAASKQRPSGEGKLGASPELGPRRGGNEVIMLPVDLH